MHGEKILFEGLYDMSIEEAKRREKVCDQKMLLSAKEFPLSQWYQPDTAKSFFWLGRVQREAGDLTTVSTVKLTIKKRTVRDHPDTAAAFHEQCVIHTFMGGNKSAVEAFRKATDINLNFHGGDIFTAHSYHSLGVARHNMADLTGALDSFQSKLLGDHEDTASSNYKIGLVQRDMGDLKRALDSLQKAANIRSSVLGDQEDTALSYNSRFSHDVTKTQTKKLSILLSF